MDNKIILAILIVALIGIVAATYQSETKDVVNTLTSVATEDTPTDSATDQLDISSEGNSPASIKIDEDVVKTDTSASTPRQNIHRQSSSSSNVRSSSSSSSSQSNSGNNNQGTNTNQNSAKISTAQAVTTAVSALPSQYQDATYTTSQTTYDGKLYYIITFFKNGKNIGYYEIDGTTNTITGGAFAGEVPDPTDNTNDNKTNTNPSNNTTST